MKALRFCSFLLALLLFFPAFVSAEADRLPGDLNGDGARDAVDYLLLKAGILARKKEIPGGDLNGDGNVTAADYLLLKAHILGTFDLSLKVRIPSFDKTVFPALNGNTEQSFFTDLRSSELTEEKKEALSSLQTLLTQTDFGFVCYDFETGHTISYRAGVPFPTASVAKLPYAKYLCTLADSGKLDFSETLVLQKSHITGGAGSLQYEPVGSAWSVGELLRKLIVESDNTAYKLLLSRFGLTGYRSALRSLGSTYSPSGNGFGSFSAGQIAALLYDVACYRGKNASFLRELGCHTDYRMQIPYALPGKTVLHKYGALGENNPAYHDVAVVYGSHPYLLVILTGTDITSPDRDDPFREIARLCDLLFG